MKKNSFYTPDFEAWDDRYRGTFFNSLGGFKSCNLIGTQNENGQTNLAIFFSVIHVGANPPYLGLLFRPHTVPRHSLENMRQNGCFTVNAVAESMLEQAHQTSAKYKDSEFEATGLTAEWKNDFPAPFVAESEVQIACRRQEEHYIKVNQTIFVVASIEAVHLPVSRIAKDGLVLHDQMNTLALNGLDGYYKPEFIKQLAYARPYEAPKEKNER